MNLKNIDSRIIALGLARMADGLANSFLIIVLPIYIASGQIGGMSFGLNAAAITGIALGCFGIVNSIVQPYIAQLSDKLGKRTLFIFTGLILIAAFNVLYLVVDSYIGILVVRILQASSAALTIVGSVSLVSELSPEEGRGRNMGIYNSFRLIGFGSGPLAAGAIISGGDYTFFNAFTLSGFDLSFYAAAAAGLVSAVIVALLVSDPDHIEPSEEEGGSFQFLGKEPGQLLDPIFTLGMATLFMAACISLLSPIETIVNERLGQGPFLFGVEFASYIGTQAIMQPYLGGLSDTYGRRQFIIIGLIGLIPATVLQGFVVAPWQMIIVRLFQGISSAMVFAPALALAGDLAKKGKTGSQLSILTISFGLGLSLGQFLSGFLVEIGYVVPFLAGGVLAAIALILVYTQVDDDSKNKKPKEGDQTAKEYSEAELEELRRHHQS